MSKSVSPTYYVLLTVSTCPVAVPLQDYCRKYPEDPEFIKENWKLIQQSGDQDNEKIILCSKPEEWSCLNR
ncbi:hypothetical protein [Sulfurimonas microaerophilic]|uniref:hypothetical protein n=1 Tax=Sulfurimonas microaerophilic TaxID=3058392 RepID=UPI0027147663|nr:hypothetical protein [Sulfurimonas sp. hsl 1-7]